MESAGVCYGGRGCLYFVPDPAKINADYYTNNRLPKLIEGCNNVMPIGVIILQDGAPVQMSPLSQDWLEQHSPDFIKKDEWRLIRSTLVCSNVMSGEPCSKT